MLSRVAYKKRRGRRWLTALVTLSVATGTFIAAGTVLAVHDTGSFELDGNAVTTLSHDWDQVCYQATTDSRCGTTTAAGAKAVSWTSDTSGSDPFVNNSNASIFTGGGSKDPQDINQWAWKDGAGGLPDKDNLVHSFAARYSLAPTNNIPATATNCPNGTGGTGQPAFDSTKKCEVLFFGSDRFDNSGDAQQGFWFFQNAIGLGSTPIGGGTSFTGVHKNGDLLIISDFSNGGSTSIISVYKWNSAVNGNLQLLATSDTAKCTAAANADAFCGLVNAGTITQPWPFLDKSGTTLNRALNGEFYEGGVNLSTLGLAGECFASVASETRSSTSTTATLKDFVLGNFGKCDTTLLTTPMQSDGTTPIPAAGLSIGATADVSVTDSAALTIDGISTWSGNLKFFLCKEANTTDTCTTPGTQIGPAAGVTVTNADTSPFVSDVAHVTAAANGTIGAAPGRYCWRAEFTHITTGVPDKSDSSANECFIINPLQSTLSTNASATVEIGSAISDTATLGNTANKPGSPVINPTTKGGPAGGTITFNLYGPGDTTCTGTIVHTATVNVSGNSVPVTNIYSDSFTPTSAGTYRWVASYTGDSPNTLGKSGACNDANESVVVSPKTPTIFTTQTPTSASALGTATSDTATIANAANKPDGTVAGGTVTFKLYGPRAVAATPNCTANLVYTSAAYAVSDNGTYPTAAQSSITPNSFTPTAAGTYDWIATYSGDSPNTSGPVSSTCGDEPVTIISLQPTISTAQTFTIKDSATIAVAPGAGNLMGSVRFRLYNNAFCTPGLNDIDLLYDTGATGIAVSGASPQMVSSGTTTITTSQPVLSWLVEYASTNTGHKNVTSACNTEHSSLSIVNQ